MPGDILDCHSWRDDVTGIYCWVEGMDVAQHPTVLRTISYSKELPRVLLPRQVMETVQKCKEVQ